MSVERSFKVPCHFLKFPTVSHDADWNAAEEITILLRLGVSIMGARQSWGGSFPHLKFDRP
jgi:hypothetical protein